jgi:hypothetical protein
MRDIEKIRKAVSETLSRDFSQVRVLDIRINEDVDSDGEEMLRIDVIFDGSPKDVDARKLSGFVRSLRPRLDQLRESALPLMSFISAADDRHLRRARA